MGNSRGSEQDIAPPPLDAEEVVGLLAALEEGILALEGCRIVGANPALVRMSGRALETLLGRSPAELIHDIEGRPIRDPRTVDAARLRTATGDLLAVSLIRLSPRLLLVADRSRERMLEQEIWQIGGAPGGVPQTESLNAFLAMIEHEIRTPVTVVNGYARMLLEEREGPLTEAQRECLETLRRSARRIQVLLDNLLVVESGGAAGPAGTLRVVRKSSSLHEIVRGGVEATRPQAEERGLSVLADLHPDADPLEADPVRLEQVVTNLISNALKFAPEGSVVRVETGIEEGEEGEVIWFAVADEGPGVTCEEAERIFLPFVRGRAARETCVQGVGLGLAICRTIVEAHGGTIEAIPSAKGGLFRVTVPTGI